MHFLSLTELKTRDCHIVHRAWICSVLFTVLVFMSQFTYLKLSIKGWHKSRPCSDLMKIRHLLMVQIVYLGMTFCHHEEKNQLHCTWDHELKNKQEIFRVCTNTHNFIFWVFTHQWQYKLNWFNTMVLKHYAFIVFLNE